MQTILIVDDERVLRDLLANLFDGKYAVTKRPNGAEAIDLCKLVPFDLVITDNDMPGGPKGIETIPEIRTLRPDIKIILMSGGGVTEEEAIKAGADAFLAKPFKSLMMVEELVAKLLGN